MHLRAAPPDGGRGRGGSVYAASVAVALVAASIAMVVVAAIVGLVVAVGTVSLLSSAAIVEGGGAVVETGGDVVEAGSYPILRLSSRRTSPLPAEHIEATASKIRELRKGYQTAQ